jgi:TonB family protein
MNVAMALPPRLISPAVSEFVAKVSAGQLDIAQRHALPPDTMSPPESPIGIAMRTVSEDGVFFQPWELDQRAEPKAPIVFSFPDTSPDASPVGILRVELRIDEQGNVLTVDMLEAKPEKVFDQAAIQALSGAVFIPAMRHGKPVKCLKIIEVVFERDGASAHQSTTIGGEENMPEQSLIAGQRRD